MNTNTRYKFKQLVVIIIAWMIMGFLISVYDHLVLLTASSAGVSADYSFWVAVARNVSAGLIGALLGGSLLVFYVNVKYQDKPYAYTIIIDLVAFIIIIMLITLLMAIVLVPLKTGKPLADPVSRAAFNKFLADTSHLNAALVWAFVVAITQLLLQVNSKFGQENFWSIIIGKYNRPKEA
jgi:adenylate cyclase